MTTNVEAARLQSEMLEAMRERDEALAEVERLRTRATICRRCGDTITPGMMNARGVLHTADGVECGVCVDTSGDAEPNADADAMTPDAEHSFRLYAAGLDMPGGTIRRVGQIIARDLLAEIDRLRGVLREAEAERDEARVEVLAYVAEADEQIRLRDEARAEVERITRERDDAIAFGIHSCGPMCGRPACVMRRERDEARAQLADISKLWDAVVDAAIDALPDGGGLVSGVAEAARQLGVARRERDEARAQLAALREAAGPHAASEYASDAETRALRIALADAEDAAEAHDRRVALAGECRGMRLAADMCCSADDIGDGGGAISAALEQVADRLSARADEIERGER